MYEHNALGYWSGLALCLTKVRSSRARCPATALILFLSWHKNLLQLYHFEELCNEPLHKKPTKCLAKTKAQISFTVTTKLISSFVFTAWIVQSFLFLNPKFQASSLLL